MPDTSFLTYFIQANGPFFLSLFGLLSFTAVTLIVWNFLRNRHARTPDEFFARRDQELQQGNVPGLKTLCEATPGLVPKLYVTAIDHGRHGKAAARNAMADLIELRLIPSQSILLPWILFIAKVAPMCGLLGTVFGMIMAFGKIAGVTKVDPSALANDIGMALFTTAEGLVIAIITILFYTVFKEKTNRLEIDLELHAEEAITLLFRRK